MAAKRPLRTLARLGVTGLDDRRRHHWPDRRFRRRVRSDRAPTTAVTPDKRWLRSARYARWLAWASLAWMTGEGIIGLIAGFAAGSDLTARPPRQLPQISDGCEAPATHAGSLGRHWPG